MKILKYKKGGDVRNDIHYTHQGKYLRFGSDEEGPREMIAAFNDLNELCSELAGITCRIKTIVYGGDYNETKIRVEAIAAAKNGEDMKITLPKVGWREGSREIPGGEFEKAIIPVGGIDHKFVEAIQTFTQELQNYARSGSRQLDLDFDNLVDEGKRLGIL